LEQETLESQAKAQKTWI